MRRSVIGTLKLFADRVTRSADHGLALLTVPSGL